jgi:hypothetical protein
MDNAPRNRKVRLGDVVVIGLLWGSGRVGKVVSSFAVELLRRGGQRDIKTFVGRVAEFRTCWYKTQHEDGSIEYKSPLMTELAGLPDALAAEVRALLGTEIVVGADIARYGLSQYILCPGETAEPGAAADRGLIGGS